MTVTKNKLSKPAKLAKLKELSEPPSQSWPSKAVWREENKDWLNESRKIALLIIRLLRAKSMTKAELAERMGVTPQYIGNVTKGEENLSLSTIKKLEVALGVKLIEVVSNGKSSAQQKKGAIEELIKRKKGRSLVKANSR